jgi:CubicO group peptidase (beta-lactamase class C family)
VAQGITSALVILVARRGVIVLHEAFGRLTPDEDSPLLTRDTIYPMSSITKSITATAIMILVEEGLLGLNRPVSDYIPEFRGDGKPAVMVHHLLTHTSGLRDEDVDAHAEKQRGSAAIPPSETTQHPVIHEHLFLRYDAPLWKPPGVEMSYGNYGYNLLGEIVRRVSGKALADFARERIFAPLGMEDTSYIVPDSVKYRIVKRPANAPFATMPAPRYGLGTREHQEIPLASSGVYSTAMDMAIFGQLFLNRGRYGDVRILSPASVAEMTRDQIPGISAVYFDAVFPEASWGLGWEVHGNRKAMYYDGTLKSPAAFGHGGIGSVYMWVDPVYDIVGVYFSVTLELLDTVRPIWCADLFQNAVTAAVVDA